MVKKLILTFLATLIVFFGVSKDSFLYHQPIGHITAIRQTAPSAVTDTYGNVDQQMTQTLTITLVNTSSCGKTFQLTNTVDVSQATGQVYSAGQDVLLSTDRPYQIVSLKRDALILALLTLFMGLLISFASFRFSFFLLLSLIANLLYFSVAIFADIHWPLSNIVLFAGLALVFAASSCFFVLGRTRQMLFTFLTTILSTGIVFGLTALILQLTADGGIHFEYLDYVTQNPKTLFFVGALISVLGAIMDGCGDIVAGLFALHRQNPATSRVDYFRSGLSIGREITGTLLNVLFMIFMAGTLPMALLLLHNGNNWSYITTVVLNLGLLQSLISALGIVLSVPITAGLVSVALTTQPREVTP